MLYHEFPGDLVAPFLVSDSLRDRIRSTLGLRQVRSVEARLAIAIETARRASDSKGIDWNLVRENVEEALSEYGEQLPRFEDTSRLWNTMIESERFWKREEK